MVQLTDSMLAELSQRLQVSPEQIQVTVNLLGSGLPVPFVARFCADQTGRLSTAQILEVRDQQLKAAAIRTRKDQLIKSATAQGRLTDQLKSEVEKAENLRDVEELYLALRNKKASTSAEARHRSLLPLSEAVISGEVSEEQLSERLTQLVGSDESFVSESDALAGLKAVIVEQMSYRREVRKILRLSMQKNGELVSTEFIEHNPDGSAESASGTKDAAASDQKSQAPGSPPTNDQAAPTKTGEDPSGGATEPAESSPVSVDGTPPTDSTDDQTTKSGEVESDHATVPAQEPKESPTKPETAEAETAKPETAKPESAKPQSPPKMPSVKSSSRPQDKPSTTVAEGLINRRRQRREARRKKRELLKASFKALLGFSRPLGKIPSQRWLALDRGERVRVLELHIKTNDSELESKCIALLAPESHPLSSLVQECAKRAYSEFLYPSIEREIKRQYVEKAEEAFVRVLARNMTQLLMSPPQRRRVLAIDPGRKFGCKVAALDERGSFLAETNIHAIGDVERVEEGRRRMKSLIEEHQISVIAIGNGTGYRQVETTVATLLNVDLADRGLRYVIVNEAGTTAYANSQAAETELPGIDLRLRATISIGRRLIDPLAEFAKVDPIQIVAGLSPHEFKVNRLRHWLVDAVENCVNQVGVDVNNAPRSLLEYVSGLTPELARTIVDHRKENAPFVSREQLKSLDGFDDNVFRLAAAFLLVKHGENPLDATRIHPDDYPIVEKVLEKIGVSKEELRQQVDCETASQSPDTTSKTATDEPVGSATDTTTDAPVDTTTETATAAPVDAADKNESSGEAGSTSGKPLAESSSSSPAESTEQAADRVTWESRFANLDVAALANEFGVPQERLADVITQLKTPGRDPRRDSLPPVLKHGTTKLEDLQPNTELSATVINVVEYGVFVNIGLRESGLIHISQLSDQFVNDPRDLVSPGDMLHVWVLNVDTQKRRVSLTAIPPGTKKAPRKKSEKSPNRQRRRPAGKPTSAAGRGSTRGKAEKPRVVRRRRPKPPQRPLTDGMKKGTEPLRSFGDLAQFYQDARTDESSDTPKGAAEKKN